VSVLHRGRVVEAGPVDRLFAHPEHDYTRRLLSSIPARSDTGGRQNVR
jgi:ABC-type dipeptide/oligopeptide/nickel transport system ATPase component